MIITRERWAGKYVFLIFEDLDSLSAGANLATKNTLPDAHKFLNKWLSDKLNSDIKEQKKQERTK